MEVKKTVRRGEIYFCNLGSNEGSVQNGARPVLVVQCDEGNRASPTTIVAAITTAVKKQHLPTHIPLEQRFGLKYDSMIMLEQLRTVNQSELVDYIGIVDDEVILRYIDNGLKKAMGLWKYKKKTADIRCLCNTCLNVFKLNPDYIVKRIDPFTREKKLCDKCLGQGYDYMVYSNSKNA